METDHQFRKYDSIAEFADSWTARRALGMMREIVEMHIEAGGLPKLLIRNEQYQALVQSETFDLERDLCNIVVASKNLQDAQNEFMNSPE